MLKGSKTRSKERKMLYDPKNSLHRKIVSMFNDGMTDCQISMEIEKPTDYVEKVVNSYLADMDDYFDDHEIPVEENYFEAFPPEEMQYLYGHDFPF